ncbi:MarR family winged helix-turn-helix transcriptional regulator [Isoalcanivorax indicus]|uniref:MarR family winged helix-turn-helix transcriptional regulator n=1 Tax=Isoalcanivorax indicus TaxID=2202653 RepID=UPI000DB9014B|nr:MarR family winged helix-turn-helix transcriptional regulator [Isoalcanivorax indicus]
MNNTIPQSQITAFRHAIDALIRAFKVSEGVQHPDLSKPLSQTDVQALLYVVAHPLCIGADLGQHLGMVPTTVSAIVDRLVRSGLLARSRTETNRRIVQLQPTAAGLRIAEQVIAGQEADCRLMLEALSDSERQHFISMFGKIALAMARQEPEP